MRRAVLILLTACTADRTISEEPPIQCGDNEEPWLFPSNDETHCVVPRPAFYNCMVSAVRGYGTTGATELTIPACDATESTLPCWRADDTVAGCGGLTIMIDRDEPSAPDDAILGWCQTCD